MFISMLIVYGIVLICVLGFLFITGLFLWGYVILPVVSAIYKIITGRKPKFYYTNMSISQRKFYLGAFASSVDWGRFVHQYYKWVTKTKGRDFDNFLVWGKSRNWNNVTLPYKPVYKGNSAKRYIVDEYELEEMIEDLVEEKMRDYY